MIKYYARGREIRKVKNGVANHFAFFPKRHILNQITAPEASSRQLDGYFMTKTGDAVGTVFNFFGGAHTV